MSGGQRLPPSTPQIDLLRVKAKPLRRELFHNFLPILTQYLNSFNHSQSIKSLKETNELLKEDLDWCIESFNKDNEELNKLQDHLEFLNADETQVTQSEIIKEFNEFIGFITGHLLDNLLMVFGGVKDSVKDENVKNFIEESMVALRKVTISLKLLASSFAKHETDLEGFQSSLDLLKKNYGTLIDLRIG